MAQFSYVAMDRKGREQKGKIDAPDQEAANVKLRKKGLFPTKIEIAVSAKAKTGQKKKKGGGFNINIGPIVIARKKLMVVTRQLAILLDAGLPLIKSLRTIERQSTDPSTKTVLGKVADTIETGATFAEALSAHPRSFDKLYLNMVRAGEASGAMETILDRLAGFMEKADRIAGKVKSAMIYPSVIMTVAIIGISCMMIFIVPNFAKIFTDMLGPGESLPALTQFMIDSSGYLLNDWPYFIGAIVGIVIIFKIIAKIPIGKFCLDWVKYHLPLFGPIIAKTSIARFGRTLGTLLGSGVPILGALAIVKETAGNEVVTRALQQVHDAVKEGEGISAPLSKTKVFPEMVISMVEVGEETGKLPELLTKIADTYEEDVDNAVSALTSMIEPLMIVMLAGIVGTLVVSLFLPLTTIIEKMAG